MKDVDLQKFESETRATIDKTLNQLQTATLLIAELETQISAAGNSVQELSQMIEDFVLKQEQQKKTNS